MHKVQNKLSLSLVLPPAKIRPWDQSRPPKVSRSTSQPPESQKQDSAAGQSTTAPTTVHPDHHIKSSHTMSSATNLSESLGAELLRCALCGDTYRAAVLLPCLHSACGACLQEYRQREADRRQDGDPAAQQQPAHMYPCPVCQTADWDSRPDPCPNHFLRNLCEVASCHSAANKECDYCRQYDSDAVDAVGRCLVCQDNLCAACMTAHKKTRQTRDHPVPTFDQMAQGQHDGAVREHQRVACGTHPEEDVTIYCCQCDQLICRDCKVTEHEKHSCSELSSVCDNFKQKNKPLLKGLHTKTPNLEKYVAFLEEYGSQLDQMNGHIVAAIEEQATTLQQQIEEYKNKLITKVQRATEEETRLVGQKKLNTEHTLKVLTQTIQYVDTLLELGKPEEILSIQAVLVERLTELAHCCPDILDSKVSMKFTPSTDLSMETMFGSLECCSVALRQEASRSATCSPTPRMDNMAALKAALPDLDDDVVAVRTFDCKGAADLKDIWPTGIAVGEDGSHYIVDRENKRVKVFNNDGELVNEFGQQLLGFPYDITIMNDGKLAVTDYDQEDIKIFTPEGGLERSIGGQVKYPRGITVDSDGNLVVVDCHSRKLVVINPNTERIVNTIGGQGENGFEIFTDPYYVTIHANGGLVASDWVSPNIKLFTGEGVYVTKYGTYGLRKDQVLQPYGVCTDRHGYIFVADNQNHRIHLLAPDGKFLRFLVTKQHGLWHPMALTINNDQHLVVTEALGKVKVFKYL